MVVGRAQHGYHACTRPPNTTKSQTFYDASGAEYAGLEVQIVGEVSAGDSAALEWEATLVDRGGRPHELRGVNIVEVRDGKFTSVRAYFDPSACGTITQDAELRQPALLAARGDDVDGMPRCSRPRAAASRRCGASPSGS